MLTHKCKLSRRGVQQKFPPGSLAIDGDQLLFVIGYAFVNEEWWVYVIRNGRLMQMHWERVRDYITLDSWLLMPTYSLLVTSI